MTPADARTYLLVTFFSLAAGACSSLPPDEGTDTSSGESDLKKKVTPTGGNGAFDLLAPTFDATGFAGTFTFAGAALAPGERSERVPGTYELHSQPGPFLDGTLMHQGLSYAISAGVIAQNTLGGLRVRFAEPVTLGSATVSIRPTAFGEAGTLSPTGPWAASRNGASMLALAGTLVVTTDTDPTMTTSEIAQGTLKEVVLPTARLALRVDAVDAAYPTPTSCTPPYVNAGGASSHAGWFVRGPTGEATGPFIVPQGGLAPLTLSAYGIRIVVPTVSQMTHSIVLNRLEIDDVQVAHAASGSTSAKGTVIVTRKNADGSFTILNCVFPTHSGIDLPDGEYLLTSSAQTAAGLITSTQSVSFP